MARKLYQANIYIDAKKDYENFLFYAENDEHATREGKALLKGIYSGGDNFVVVEAIEEVPGAILPNFRKIFDSTCNEKLALTPEQRRAVENLYSALEMVQSLNVHLIEDDCRAIYAFNGNDVEEWNGDYCGEDQSRVNLKQLYYAGPTFYEQSVCAPEICVRFKG